ncbi:M24 family metallopeptidase [Halovivax cerinus]|uniref:M24 family metallopeptidase n=1 Tax=Halovivax cerinus TaxID=1487865 RepID=A0ABD5NRA1_9EURY|nr:M24 family metallopeptidase [Halovivax cerinus]
MTDRRDRIVDAASALDADGYLVDASTRSATQHYLAGFDAGEPFLSLVTADGIAQLFWGVDHETARTDGLADDVYRGSDFGYDGYGDADARNRVARRFVDHHDVGSVAVPDRFPLGTARTIERIARVDVVESDPIADLRARKSPAECEAIRAAAGAVDAAHERVASALAAAAVSDGRLTLGGEPLTGRSVERRIREAVLAEHCTLADAVVASGPDAANPHGSTDGALGARVPIVVDVVARHRDSGYHADGCRTFVVGEPPSIVRDRHETVRNALDEVASVLRPGVATAAVNDTLCAFFEERGFATPRTDPDAEAGVLHYMAHGVGLDVHERPLCTPDGDGVVERGHVLAVEPAVYGPDWGGVRIEDVFAITEDGCRRLSTSDRDPEPRPSSRSDG